MTPVLTDRLMSSIRFAHNYRSLKAYFLEISPRRFRGLGDEHCRIFATYAFNVSDSAGFRYLEETQYIVFLMSFLGTHFVDDPRYAYLAAEIGKPPPESPAASDPRIPNCYRWFSGFSNRFLGGDLSIWRRAAAQYAAEIDELTARERSPEVHLRAFFRAYAFSSEEMARFPGRAMHQAASETMHDLGMSCPLGEEAAMALVLWLGTGVSRDPLYPWVRDQAEAAGPSRGDRAARVYAYAKKRLAYQISPLTRELDV